MKSYPKIEHFREEFLGKEFWAFDKLDGSNLRFEWNRKKGWYKFGTRNNMMDRSYPEFGSGIDLFINKYGDDLESVFSKKYKTVENFVIFLEYFGENSFAGSHHKDDQKDVVIFDVNAYKRGFLPPNEFIDNFGHLHIPKIIGSGKLDYSFIKSVKENNYGLKEGVIIKGVNGKETWMIKAKTNLWLEKLKSKFGESALIEEFGKNHLELSR
jgi:hypothetical protein